MTGWRRQLRICSSTASAREQCHSESDDGTAGAMK
jgi:hypothetical protein